MADLPFSCRCGAVAGTLASAPQRDTRVICHCADCRGFVRATSGRDPGADGVGIVQTAPESLRIDRGAEHLRALKMSPKSGFVRWYADCCGTPLAGMPRRQAVPFVGLLTDTIADPAPLGRVLARGFLPPKEPGGRQRHEGLGTMAMRMIRRGAASRFSGRWRESPFLEGGQLRSAPRPLTPEERAAAYS